MSTITVEFRQYMNGYSTMPPSAEEQGMSLAQILAMPADERRLPVANREPRELMSKQKYALIIERDGLGCRYCYEGNEGIHIDHIVPRSAFPAHLLHVADRSDNLTVSCIPCNMRKSNKDYRHAKRPGVTPACWECLNPAPDPECDPDGYGGWGERAAVSREHLVFCGRCGMGGSVPNLGWVL